MIMINEKGFSELALTKIIEIQEQRGCDMFEAATVFCTENDIDAEDFVKKLKGEALNQIKRAAVNGLYVRKIVALPSAELPI